MRAISSVRFVLIAMVWALLIMPTTPLGTITSISDQQTNRVVNPSVPSVSGSITVASNSDFMSPPWSGLGTESSPYYIRDMIIDLSGLSENGIVILDTDAYFEIINCTIISGTGQYGVLFSNVTNGALYNNTIIAFSSAGVRLSHTVFTELSGNRIESCYNGVELDSFSYNNTVTLNTFVRNTHFGLYASAQSGNNTVYLNTFDGNGVEACDDAITVDNLYYSNYWCDYSGSDLDIDGIGDTPYVIDGEQPNNEDNSPQMIPPTVDPLSWNETPCDQLAQLGYNFEYDLNVTAYAPGHTWTINDTVHFNIDLNGLITNATVLPEGQRYGVSVQVKDTYSNVLNAEFEIAVQDTTPPEWIEIPTDQIVEFGDAFEYDLNATDSSEPLVWHLNDTVHFDIDPATGVITNKTNLEVGVYPLRVAVNDTWSQMAIADISIIIVDTICPIWMTPVENQIIEFGTPFAYHLNASDLAGIDTWWLSPSNLFSIDPSGVVSNATLLEVGVYSVTVWVNDTHGVVSASSFEVTVQDTTSPVWIDAPDSSTIELGDTICQQFEAWDLSGIEIYAVNTSLFSVSNDGVLVVSGTVKIGNYSLLIMAIDPYGNSVISEIIITFIDTKAPVWTNPPTDHIVELGHSLNVTLSADDPSGINNWWVNNTAFAISDGVLTIPADLPVGIYGVEIRAIDPFNHALIGCLRVNVVDTTPPMLTDLVYNQVLAAGMTFQLQINATDLSGMLFWSMSNTTFFNVTSTGLVTSHGPLDEGVYPIQVTITDAYGNAMTVDFELTVLSADDQALVTNWSYIGAGVVAVSVGAGVIVLLYRRNS